jgi:NADPH:quinone reductase-like Zn-dependent oxidoreductase
VSRDGIYLPGLSGCPFRSSFAERQGHHYLSSSPVSIAGVTRLPPVPLQFKASNINGRFVLVYDMPEMAKHAALQETTWLLEGEKLRHVAGLHFPLESVRQAHQALEGGAIAKGVFDVTEGT